MIDTSRSPSEATRPARFVVAGNPGGRRVAGFQAALAARGLPPATVVSFAGLLDGGESLEGAIAPGSILRVESPGQEFAVERALIAAGADVPDDGAAARIGREAALRLEPDRGRILYPRQWYLGFREALRRIERQRAGAPPHDLMNDPADIAVMFDKVRCHELFIARGVPCPRGLGMPSNFDDLKARMAVASVRRAFVKLAHGSSASGVVAYQTDGRRELATTTVEMARDGGELRLYNSRTIRRYDDRREVADLIDALCRERAHAEQWVPKATLAGQVFDLRVLVIAGRAAHAVVRMSRTSLTNLHLRNRRGDLGALRARLPAGRWEAALSACEGAAAIFAGSLYAGIDLLIAAGFRGHAVLEANAFGDLLPGVEHRGMDTYSAEVAAALARHRGEAA